MVGARVSEFRVGVSISESGFKADRGGVRTFLSPAGAGCWNLLFGGFVLLDIGIFVTWELESSFQGLGSWK
jgi:hypothetical protein